MKWMNGGKKRQCDRTLVNPLTTPLLHTYGAELCPRSTARRRGRAQAGADRSGDEQEGLAADQIREVCQMYVLHHTASMVLLQIRLTLRPTMSDRLASSGSHAKPRMDYAHGQPGATRLSKPSPRL